MIALAARGETTVTGDMVPTIVFVLEGNVWWCRGRDSGC